MPPSSKLDACFNGRVNDPGNPPRATRVLSPHIGQGFEQRAFAALFRNAAKLGIASLWKCNSARMDGYVITDSGEFILLEMKESLRWGSTQSSTFQFLAGRDLLKLKAKRGIIVFERWSDEWGNTRPYGAWGQLALHASEVSRHVVIGALQVKQDGKIKFPPTRVA